MASYHSAEFGLIHSKAGDVVRAFCEWQAAIFEPLGWRLKVLSGDGGPAEAMDRLLPLATAPITRHLFVSAKSGWTAYFDNGPHGTDAAPIVAVLSRRLGAQAIRCVAAGPSHHDIPAWLRQEWGYPAVIFEYYENSSTAALGMYSANDGGLWKHGSFGRPIDGVERSNETVTRSSPMTIKRLSELLVDLGAEPFEADWYSAEWFLVEKHK